MSDNKKVLKDQIWRRKGSPDLTVKVLQIQGQGDDAMVTYSDYAKGKMVGGIKNIRLKNWHHNFMPTSDSES